MAVLLRVFLPFSAGYYLSFLFRNVNAVIYSDLVAAIGLDAAALGLLTSAYLLPFAAFQIPLGLLLDRFGPRRVDAALLFVAGIGAVAFSFGGNTGELVAARVLIGIGTSGCLMSAMKAFTLWYPTERFAVVNAWLLAVGGLGAMSATAPVEAALHLTDWRGIFQVLAVVTFLVAAVILWIAPERSTEATGETFAELLSGLRRVLASALFWRVGLVGVTQLGISMALQGLWIAPWLRDIAGLERAATAAAMFAIMIAMACGFLLFGVFAPRLAARGWTPMSIVGPAATLGFLALAGIALVSFIGASPALAVGLWIAFVFFTAAASLGFTILTSAFPKAYAGRVSTSYNMISFVGAFFVQFGVGPVLDSWPVDAGRYSPAAYGAALATLAFLQFCALANFFTRGRRARE